MSPPIANMSPPIACRYRLGNVGVELRLSSRDVKQALKSVGIFSRGVTSRVVPYENGGLGGCIRTDFALPANADEEAAQQALANLPRVVLVKIVAGYGFVYTRHLINRHAA